ncbi:MAG TPA: ATP-binding protein [Ktedonobacterales bacterium]|nr:ATP-binding protein [Ktedonobacterales bacterium]
MTHTPHPQILKLDLGQKKEEALRYSRSNPDVTLAKFLGLYHGRTPLPLPQDYYSQPLSYFLLEPITMTELGENLPSSSDDAESAPLRKLLDDLYQADLNHHTNHAAYPARLGDTEAVQIAYRDELEAVAAYLENDLSVLISCDKILTEHIYDYVCKRAGRMPVLDDSVPAEAERAAGARDALNRVLQGQAGQSIEANIPLLIRSLRDGQVLVLRSLDVLDTPSLIEVLYQGASGEKKPQLLGFLDPSLEVKKVLTNRFAIRFPIMGLPRYIRPAPGDPNIHTVERLITAKERGCFKDFDAEGLYKNVAGLNAIQFRNAMRYVGATVAPDSRSRDIYYVIRQFKTSASDEIEIPDTNFKNIGGYEQVKDELKQIVALTTGHVSGLDESERQKLIPRGLIFHGPPGTGKTLFAKAIANEMNATIQMVSGPEIMDKYVGQSESNLRHIFATARRNAPSVIFFDEFDSIAGQRSAYSADGGSRANNAVVAQLLTELDGFREDQAVLVIGTTNRIDIIDEALLRPSRFRPIEIGLPNNLERRSVAAYHAEKFRVVEILSDLCKLALEHLPAWEKRQAIPPAFLQALFSRFPSCRERYETQRQTTGLARELEGVFHMVKATQKQQPGEDAANTTLKQIEQRLVQIAQNYGVNLNESTAPGSLENNKASRLMQSTQNDLLDLFKLLQEEQRDNRSFSPEMFVSSVLNLIAEYTESFNNDEIRAVFQEASLEYHLEGVLITPRFLGMKVGLIRKRRDERQTVHLSTLSRRH